MLSGENAFWCSIPLIPKRGAVLFVLRHCVSHLVATEDSVLGKRPLTDVRLHLLGAWLLHLLPVFAALTAK